MVFQNDKDLDFGQSSKPCEIFSKNNAHDYIRYLAHFHDQIISNSNDALTTFEADGLV